MPMMATVQEAETVSKVLLLCGEGGEKILAVFKIQQVSPFLDSFQGSFRSAAGC